VRSATCYNPAQTVEPRPRTFTREEANALLPEVDRLLERAQQLAEKLASAEQRSQAEHWKVRANGKIQAEPPKQSSEAVRRTITQQLGGVLEQIQRTGVIVRDIGSGLIDFPSLREGRLVNLCWRRGEPLDIQWWHEVGAGFPGRQRL
jgi:hypothetical protein